MGRSDGQLRRAAGDDGGGISRDGHHWGRRRRGRHGYCHRRGCGSIASRPGCAGCIGRGRGRSHGLRAAVGRQRIVAAVRAGHAYSGGMGCSHGQRRCAACKDRGGIGRDSHCRCRGRRRRRGRSRFAGEIARFGATASRECKEQGKQHNRRQRRENPIDIPAQRTSSWPTCSLTNQIENNRTQSRKIIRRLRSLLEWLANACLPAPAYLALLCILEDRRQVRLIERYPNVTDRVHEWMLGDHFGGTHQAAKEGGLRNSTSEQSALSKACQPRS